MTGKKYVFSKERRVLHSLECRHVKHMREQNKVYVKKRNAIMTFPLCMHCANQMFKTKLEIGENERLKKLFEGAQNAELWFELLIIREAEVEKLKEKLRILLGEDMWQIVPDKYSKSVQLFHNNYIVASDVRYFEKDYHVQFKHMITIEKALKCILEYDFQRYQLVTEN